MCSLAYRYSKVHRELGCLMNDLYSALPLYRQSHHLVHLPDCTKSTIKLWRAFLVLNQIQRSHNISTGRCIDTFRVSQPSFVVEFDGCPKGIGFRIFSLSSSGVEHLIEEHGLSADFDLNNDSQYQNMMELAAAVCGLVRCLVLYGPGSTIICRGDSEVALSWLNDDQASFQSSRARGPAMVLIALQSSFDISISPKNVHISKDTNLRADALSRCFSLESIESIPIYRASYRSSLSSVLDLCNPLTQPRDETALISRWALILSTLNDCIRCFVY